jgi:hypothetical protein
VIIKFEVTLLDFVHVLFRADVKDIVVFSNHVDNSDLASLLRQLTDTKTFILPPRRFKRLRIPRRVRGDRWNVKVAAEGAVPPVKVSLGADGTFGLNKNMVRFTRSTYFKGDRVKPVSDIGTSNSFDRLAEFSLVFTVLGQKLCEVINESKEGDLAVV